MQTETVAERLARHRIVVTNVRICIECGRNFVLTDEGDADEWQNGHDCEVAG
jgi:ferredoxin-like protein FixX